MTCRDHIGLTAPRSSALSFELVFTFPLLLIGAPNCFPWYTIWVTTSSRWVFQQCKTCLPLSKINKHSTNFTRSRWEAFCHDFCYRSGCYTHPLLVVCMERTWRAWPASILLPRPPWVNKLLLLKEIAKRPLSTSKTWHFQTQNYKLSDSLSTLYWSLVSGTSHSISSLTQNDFKDSVVSSPIWKLMASIFFSCPWFDCLLSNKPIFA